MTKITYIPNRVIDADGISDGAALYVYQSGTTTPVSLFLDSGLTIPSSNPYVVATGAAVPPLYTSYVGDIRFRVVSIDGSVVQDDDPYQSLDAMFSASDGSSLVGFIQDGTGAVARTLQNKGREVFHAMDLLGDDVDPAADHGALLTAAIEARFGTLATSQSRDVKTIEFGDARYTYNIVTPIIVQQNYIRLVGDGAILQCSGDNAIVGDHDASANILFGFEVDGFTLKGTVTNDAIVIKSGSQCAVRNIRNHATIGLAVVWLTGTISTDTYNIRSDNSLGNCTNVIKESVYEKTAGNFFSCIANRHYLTLAYTCTGAGFWFNESDAPLVEGADIEACDGPGILLHNTRFARLSAYFEVNGQTATGAGDDLSCDIRVTSGGGTIVSQSSNNLITGCQMGGAFGTGVAIHLVDADNTVIVENALGDDIKINAGCLNNYIGVQQRMLGVVTDAGSDTVDMSSWGKTTYKAGPNVRLTIDSQASGGAKVGSDQSLMRLYGITSMGAGTTVGANTWASVDIADAATTGTITFSTAEPDSNYVVLTGLWDTSGAAATRSVRVTSRGTTGISVALDVAPGAGQSVRVWCLVFRTA